MWSLETKNLYIRELTKDDFDDYFALCHQPDIHPYVSHISHDKEVEYARFISYIQMVYGFYGFGLWGIYLKENDTLIGQAGIESQLVEDTGEITLSYFVDPDHQRHGYGFEACRAILDYSADELEFNRITAIISPENIPSRRLAEKLGFDFKKMIFYQNTESCLYVRNTAISD